MYISSANSINHKLSFFFPNAAYMSMAGLILISRIPYFIPGLINLTINKSYLNWKASLCNNNMEPNNANLQRIELNKEAMDAFLNNIW